MLVRKNPASNIDSADAFRAGVVSALVGFLVYVVFVDARSSYSDSDQQVTLGLVPSAVSGSVLVLSVLVCLVALSDQRVKVGALHYVVFAYTSFYCLVSVWNDGLVSSAPVFMAAAAIFAFSLRAAERGSYAKLVQILLRFVVLFSLGSAVVNPSWALVPYGYDGRGLLGLDSRLIGLATTPNYIALAGAVLFLIEINQLLTGRKLKLLNGAFLLLSISVVVWAQSRSILAAVLIITVAVAVVRNSAYLARSLVLFSWVAIAFALTVVAVVRFGGIGDAEVFDDVSSGRLAIWSSLLANVEEFFWAGAASEDVVMFQLGAANAHNGFLESTVRGGIIFAILTTLLLAALSRVLWRDGREAIFGSMLLLLVSAQFAFGTPMRAFSLSWNLLVVLLLVGECCRLRALSRLELQDAGQKVYSNAA